VSDQTPESEGWQDFYKDLPSTPPAPTAKPLNIKRIVTLAIALPLAVLLGGWITTWLRTPSEPLANTGAERPAVAIPPVVVDKIVSPTPTAPARKITIAAPDKLGGRTRSTEAALVKAAADSQAMLSGMPQATNGIAVFYGSTAKRNVVFVKALTTKVTATPSAEDPIAFLTLMMIEPGIKVVKEVKTVDAGPLGGFAACGEFDVKGVQVAGCAWGDESSIGGILWYEKSMQKAQAEFHALRAEIEEIG